MKWSTLKKMYNYLLASSLLILGFLSTLTLLPYSEILQNTSLPYIAIGAILLSVMYIIFISAIPDSVNDFSLYDYINRNIEFNKHDYLNKDFEFKFLEKKSKEINKFDYIKNSHHSDQEYIKEFNIQKINNVIGQTQSVQILSHIKYLYFDYEHTKTRWMLTIMFFVSVGLIYHASIYRIYNFIIGGILNVL